MRPVAVEIPQVVDHVGGRGRQRERQEGAERPGQHAGIGECEGRQQRHEDQQVLEPLVQPQGAHPRAQPGGLGGKLPLDRHTAAYLRRHGVRDAD
ncbi:MAG: hypothetical protein ACK559_08270, partial [bacterium]